jgi:hypothetical protein
MLAVAMLAPKIIAQSGREVKVHVNPCMLRVADAHAHKYTRNVALVMFGCSQILS